MNSKLFPHVRNHLLRSFASMSHMKYAYMFVREKKKKSRRKIPDTAKMSKHFSTWRVYGAQQGGKKKLSLKNLCERGKNKTQTHNAPAVVSFDGHTRGLIN